MCVKKNIMKALMIVGCMALLGGCGKDKKEDAQQNSGQGAEQGQEVQEEVIPRKTFLVTQEKNYVGGALQGIIKYEYTDQGKLKKKSYLHAAGDVYEWEEYTDSEENANGLKAISHTADGAVEGWCEYLYDAKDGLIRQTYFDEFGFAGDWERFENEYDAKGNLTKRTKFDCEGVIRNIVVYEYDGKGNKTKETEYSETDVLAGWTIYDLDAQGMATKATHYGADGTQLGWEEYVIDGDGNPTKVTFHEADGSSDKYAEYEYVEKK